MATIIDPTQDQSAYEQIADLVGTSSTPAQIDANPLFRAAEDYMLHNIPTAADRNHAERNLIVTAVIFIAAYFMLAGGGTTATRGIETVTGPIRSKSQTIGSVTLREDYSAGGTTTIQSSTVGDRLLFLRERINFILALLGLDPLETDAVAVEGKQKITARFEVFTSK